RGCPAAAAASGIGPVCATTWCAARSTRSACRAACRGGRSTELSGRRKHSLRPRAEPRTKSRKPRAKSRKPRAKSREPKAESRKPKAESRTNATTQRDSEARYPGGSDLSEPAGEQVHQLRDE